MIRIYTTPTCAYCPMVKKYLDMKSIPYESKDALTDPIYPALANKYGMTVPLIYNTETDQGTVGYNISNLNKIAGL